MKSSCIEEVARAIGRGITEKQAARFEQELIAERKTLTRSDPEFAKLSRDEQLMQAAKLLTERKSVEASKQAQRRASNLLAQARESAHLNERAKTIGGKNPMHKALFERMKQIDLYIAGIKNELFSNLMDTINAAEPRFWKLMENPKAVADFAKEVYGVDTGNPIAKKGAKAYLDVVENIRSRLNAAGASVGKLDYGWLPQPHDAAAIGKASKSSWVDSVLPKMRRDKFVNDDGSLMSDSELQVFLGHAYDTLSTEGAVKREAGQSGGGSRASRFDDAHRVLHFKDADSYLDYMNEFGSGSLFEAVQNHVNAQAKNIGMMEEWGANPAQTYRYLKDTAEIADSKAAGKKISGDRKQGATLDMFWDVLNGTTATPVDQRLAARGQQIRNYMSMVKLGGAMLSSVTDAPMWVAAAKYAGVPTGKAMKYALKALGTNQEGAARLGLAVESMSSEMQSWHAENMRKDWTRKGADFVMRAQFLEAWTHKLRGGFSMMMQDHLAEMVKTDFGSLSALDQERLMQAGVTKRDWEIWQKAVPEEINGRPMLTKNSIRDIDADSVRAIVAHDLNQISDATKAEILKLEKRNEQDQVWLRKRKENMLDWISKMQSSLLERSVKLDEKKAEKLSSIARRLGELYGKIDASRDYFDQSRKNQVSFSVLRKEGIKEGVAKNSANHAASKIRASLRELESVKRKLGVDFESKFAEKEARISRLIEAGSSEQEIAYAFNKLNELHAEASDRLAVRIEKKEASISDASFARSALASIGEKIANADKVWADANAARPSFSIMRAQGVKEGRAERMATELKKDIRDISKEIESTKLEAALDIAERWAERKNEIDEFSERAAERAKRRQFVASRLDRDAGAAQQSVLDGAINEATARLLGFIDSESKNAVLSPDLGTRAMMTQGTKAGTYGGEFLRMLTLFKSFPMALMFKQLDRIRTIAKTQGRGSAALYSVSTMAGLTLFGALAMQLKDFASGKDPRDMSQSKSWLAAFMQGGGFGIFGDIVYTGMGGNSRGGQKNYSNLAGPVFGTLGDLSDVTLGNLGDAMQGKKTNLGAELLRVGKQNTPLVNLWYLRAAVDHMLVNDLQENLSPGYLSRMRQRARKDFGQEYWWEPGDKTPQRAPDFSAAVGND